jgi:hypothetical protein
MEKKQHMEETLDSVFCTHTHTHIYIERDSDPERRNRNKLQ